MTDVDLAQLDFSVGTPCPRNNPYCGNTDRHVHGSFACELRCPCRSGFSEEARVQAAKDWSYQRTPDDYLRKLLSENFGLNSNSPDYNDQLWISGLNPPISVAEAGIIDLIYQHFGIRVSGPNYLEIVRNLADIQCLPAQNEQRVYDYIELNFEQVSPLVAAKYAIKTERDYRARGGAWVEKADQAVIIKNNNVKKARELGVPQAQIDRFLADA